MFTDLTSLLLDNPPSLHYGVAVTDLDDDGEPELFVAGYGCPNRVLKWTGHAFADVAPAALADADRRAIGVAAGDLDGDGREEIYVLNTDTFAGPKQFADRLFDFKNGQWHDLFADPANQSVRNLAAGRSVVCLDRRGTGRYAFFVANYGRPMRLYELSPTGELEDVAEEAGVALTTGGRGAVALPLVSEGIDLFAVNELGANFLFRSRGDGTFEEVAGEFGLADPEESGRGVTAGDFDGDGRFDLAYGNWEGPHRLMLRVGAGRFKDRATLAMALPSQVRTVLAADFDNDGFEELFFNNIGEPNRLFGQRNGVWSALDIGPAMEPDGLGTGAAVGDFDGDGRLELLIAHGESGLQPLSLYRGSANDHAWLRVMPRTRQGAPARGAVVRLRAGGRTQIRVIDGGSGYLCQMEPVAHFGLGTVTRVDRIEVCWPDGATRALETPAVRQVVEVEHPG